MNLKDIIIVVLLVVVVLQLMGGNPLTNEEIIEWTDYRGNSIKVRVDRRLH